MATHEEENIGNVISKCCELTIKGGVNLGIKCEDVICAFVTQVKVVSVND